MWVPIYDELLNNPKRLIVSKKLRINKHETIGRLCEFWLFVSKYAKNGDITEKIDYIEEVCNWNGECGAFIQALIDARFIIKNGKKFEVKDWYDHTGKFLEQSEKHKERMRAKRIKDKEKLLEEANEQNEKQSSEYNGSLTNTSQLQHCSDTQNMSQLHHRASTVLAQLPHSDKTECDNSASTVMIYQPTNHTNQPYQPTIINNTCPKNLGSTIKETEEEMITEELEDYMISTHEEESLPDDLFLTDIEEIDKSIPVSVENTVIESYPQPVDKPKKSRLEAPKEWDSEFEILWAKYPRKEGKTKARLSYFANKRKGITFSQYETAIDNYCKEKKHTEFGYLQMGSTFFNSGFEDYLEGTPSERAKKEQQEKQNQIKEERRNDSSGSSTPEEIERLIQRNRERKERGF